MTWNKEHKIFFLTSIQMLWGVVLWISISRFGMGVSRDSVEYMFTGLNLASGKGFISFADQPYVLWPPLYPSLLAWIHLISGQDMFISAHILQFLTFVALSLSVSILFIRIVRNNFWLSVLGVIMGAAGQGPTLIFQTVGSDYLHLLLAMVSILLSMEYTCGTRQRTIWLMSIMGMFAILQRYIGLAVIVTNGLIILFYTPGALRTKLKRSLWMTLSILPAAIWMSMTLSQSPSRFLSSSPSENIFWFSAALLDWFTNTTFLAAQHPMRFQYALWGPWIAVAGMALIVLLTRVRYKSLNGDSIPILLYGLVYGIILLGSASLTSFNRLDGRFIAPIYIPFIVLVILTANAIFERCRETVQPWINRLVQVGGTVCLLLLGGILLGRSLDLVVQAYKFTSIAGAIYNTREWNENAALQYWKEHQPNTAHLTFSNYNPGVAFHTWQSTYPSPRRSSNPDSSEFFPLEDYKEYLFVPGKESYLIWIEPNQYTHVYNVDELRQIANIETLFENEDGGVYRLRPK